VRAGFAAARAVTVNLTHITSRSNPLLVRLKKLAGDPVAYRKQGQVWIEGEHLCHAYAQRGGSVPQAVIADAAWQQGGTLRKLAERADAVAVLPESLMKHLSGLESNAPLAYVIAWPGAATLQTGAPSLVLDRVQDAGNVGTTLRSAAAFGFTQVLALAGTAGLWSPKVLRAGMGAHFALNLVEGLDESALSNLSVPLLAADPHASTALHEHALPWPCAWLFGHEGQGIAAALRSRCVHALRIPQPGGEESLNVASAAAVCMYESMRQQLRA
jgi:RNA methyltransferase, TrmH family